MTSSCALSPRLAVASAAVLNFVGAFISLEVAATVAQDIVQGFAAQGAGAATILASTTLCATAA